MEDDQDLSSILDDALADFDDDEFVSNSLSNAAVQAAGASPIAPPSTASSSAASQPLHHPPLAAAAVDVGVHPSSSSGEAHPAVLASNPVPDVHELIKGLQNHLAQVGDDDSASTPFISEMRKDFQSEEFVRDFSEFVKQLQSGNMPGVPPMPASAAAAVPATAQASSAPTACAPASTNSATVPATGPGTNTAASPVSGDDIDQVLNLLSQGVAQSAADPTSFSDVTGDDSELVEKMMEEFASKLKDRDPADIQSQLEEVMNTMFDKNFLFRPFKDLAELYPPWLENNKHKLSAEDYDNYTKQNEYLGRIMEVIDDDRMDKQQQTDAVMRLVDEMQEYGPPPEALTQEMAQKMGVDPSSLPGDGRMPQFPVPPNMADGAPECILM